MEVICRYCGTMQSVQLCTNCGQDIEWIWKAYEASEYYYAKGYYAGASGSVTKGIAYLEEAIRLNKYHINARNLLGVFFFHIGEVSNALKTWILSEALQKEENVATRYLAQLQDSQKEVEQYKKAISLYNGALTYLQNKNEDMAIIRLKKALQCNSQFVRAKNLLALCYMQVEQPKKALEQVQESLRLDKGNEQALQYLAQLQDEGAEIPKRVVAKKEDTYTLGQKKADFLRNLLYFVGGGGCVLGVMVALVVPSQIRDREEALLQSANKLAIVEGQLKQVQQDYETQTAELAEANQQLETYVKEIQSGKKVILQQQLLGKAEALRSTNDWVGCAAVIAQIEVSYLDDLEAQKYESLKEAVYAKAAKKHYDTGYNLFWTGKYIEAKVEMEQALVYDAQTSLSADAMYYLGEIEEKGERVESALSLYEQVVSAYPKSNAATRAKWRIKAIGA